MNKDNLLQLIAETAYHVGFGAKKNFATFDIVETVPGLLSFISLVVGVYALFVPRLATADVGAVMVVLGVVTLYVGFYQQDKNRYEQAGVELTRCFYDLRTLYSTVKSLPDDSDFTSYEAEHKAIADRYLGMSVSKQIFLSDWYAHFKFFWQQQIEWVDEQKKFKLLRDKLPLSFIVVVGIVVAVVVGYLLCRGVPNLCSMLF